MSEFENEIIVNPVCDKKHVLSELLIHYVKRFSGGRPPEYDHLDNMVFHSLYGLELKVPEDWPILESIKICWKKYTVSSER